MLALDLAPCSGYFAAPQGRVGIGALHDMLVAPIADVLEGAAEVLIVPYITARVSSAFTVTSYSPLPFVSLRGTSI